MRTISAGIIGGAGYTGGEMIRLLLRHPGVEIKFIHSKSNAGKPLHAAHEDLFGETDRVFDADFTGEIDVLFLCVGHGEAKRFMDESGSRFDGVRIIDLSQDFRLRQDGKPAGPKAHPFIYGLPELNRDEIRNATAIANPGCFATAIQLGLLPLAKAGLLTEVYSTGITGSTGAGQSLSSTAHFSWRANNIQAYKTLTHQHLKEIGETLAQLQTQASAAPAAHTKSTTPAIPAAPAIYAIPAIPAAPAAPATPAIHFVPWRGDFTRGIFVSSQLRCDKDPEEVLALFEDFYTGHPFTHVSHSPISLKQVVNTNKCLIQLEQSGNQLVVHSALDNLLKGASGQAVQNMNLLFGFDETAGLQLKPTSF
jgi:N-acetyl-gamma-glutamyl-phosphate reductase